MPHSRPSPECSSLLTRPIPGSCDDGFQALTKGSTAFFRINDLIDGASRGRKPHPEDD